VQVSGDVPDGLRCGLNVRGEDGRHWARASLAVEEVRVDIPGLDEDGGDVVPKEEKNVLSRILSAYNKAWGPRVVLWFQKLFLWY